MSNYDALRAVSQTLLTLLTDNITNNSDPQLNGVKIDLRTPKEMEAGNDSEGISLWLYRVTRNADLLNQPNQRPVPNQIAHTPLPLDLYYLVTPMRSVTADEQTLLGRVLQVLNDHTMLYGSDLKGGLAGTTAELRVTLEALTLEEISRVWMALQEPYRLSVSYHVQVVSIDSDREPMQTAPVTLRRTQHNQIISVS